MLVPVYKRLEPATLRFAKKEGECAELEVCGDSSVVQNVEKIYKFKVVPGYRIEQAP